MSKRWSKWIKSGAAWARIRASEARLAVYVTFYFPRNIIKKIMYQTFLPQSGILNKSIIHIDFITVCMNVAKEPIFIYRWNIIFFLHFHPYISYSYSSHGTRYLLKIEQILQFSAVVTCVNQHDEFLFFNCTKNSAHLKIMVPGLRGPAGGPCKSGDITGWGLKRLFLTLC